jgi:rSAM/selenodomain-associated transferase 2
VIVSVVIPVYNEERTLPDCLRALAPLCPPWEVLVVDGGSADRTVEAASAAAIPGLRVLAAPRGRGAQLNAGAAAARGEVLLFLHADVRLPPEAPSRIEEALADPQVVAGAFRTWTVAGDAPPLLAPFLHLADLRSRYTRVPYGDQALFVRAEVLRQVGGFSDIPLMEDVDLSRRLRRVGRVRTVPARVSVSGRRFAARPVASAVCMNVFPILFRLGVSPRLLARLYGDPR